jgi:hypothetical protein
MRRGPATVLVLMSIIFGIALFLGLMPWIFGPNRR